MSEQTHEPCSNTLITSDLKPWLLISWCSSFSPVGLNSSTSCLMTARRKGLCYKVALPIDVQLSRRHLMACHCFSLKLWLADVCQRKRTDVTSSYTDAGRESAAHMLTACSRENSHSWGHWLACLHWCTQTAYKTVMAVIGFTFQPQKRPKQSGHSLMWCNFF